MKSPLFFIMSIFLVFPVYANEKLSEALQKYAWEKRQLIVFSPSIEDSRYQLFLNAKKELSEGFNDRRLHVWHVVEGQNVKLDKQVQNNLKTSNFQKTYGVNSTEFKILLIGYDQQEKLRQSEVQIEYLFAEIDQMPMRIQEMQGDVK